MHGPQNKPISNLRIETLFFGASYPLIDQTLGMIKSSNTSPARRQLADAYRDIPESLYQVISGHEVGRPGKSALPSRADIAACDFECPLLTQDGNPRLDRFEP